MKLQELKSKIKTEEFDTVCLLIYDAIIENKITPEQFVDLIEDVTKEFDFNSVEDEYSDDFDDGNDLFDNFDDNEFNDDY